MNLAQQIIVNQQLAASTQQALRNNRRVIRQPVNSAVNGEARSDTESGSATVNSGSVSSSPAFDDRDVSEAVQIPIPVQTAVPIPIAATSRAVATTKRKNNVVTLPSSSITVSPLDLPTDHFSAALERRKQNRHLLLQWLSTALVDDIDFGRIHVVGRDRCQLARIGKMKDCMDPGHWSKPCLFKPGAEKITSMLGMTVHYPSLRDYEAAVLSQVEIQMIVMRCELHDAHGNVVAEGVGARNLDQDYGDINKAFKMVAKSAHIDATLRLAGISAMFTQDIEDKPPMLDTGEVNFDDPPPNYSKQAPVPVPKSVSVPVQVQAPVQRATGASKAKAAEPAPAVAVPNQGPGLGLGLGKTGTDLVSNAELAALRNAITSHGFTEKRVLSWLTKFTQGAITNFEQLPKAIYASLLKRLEYWAEAETERFSSSSPTTTPANAD